MQADYYFNAAGNQQPLYYANGFNAAGGAQDRFTSQFASRARADIGIDSRTQTSYGTLRTFIVSRTDNLDQGTVTPAINRAFIQWAGFTFGRARSFTDPEGMAGGGSGMLMLTQCQHCSDTVGGGAGLIAYTWEVGNGMSLSFGGEERRTKALVNLNQNFTVAANVETPAIPNNANPTSNRAGENFPNPWLAFRMAQAWGSFSAAIVGNLNNANYYGGSRTSYHLPGRCLRTAHRRTDGRRRLQVTPSVLEASTSAAPRCAAIRTTSGAGHSSPASRSRRLSPERATASSASSNMVSAPRPMPAAPT